MKRTSQLLIASIVGVTLAASACKTTSRPDILLADAGKQPPPGMYASGSRYAIASQGHHAPRAGMKMLELGGNLVDAAAAISFVHAVERPQSTGLGGGGFMLVHAADTGNTVAVDFRETAPAAAEAEMFLDANGRVIPRASLDGIAAGAVPGMVRGVLEVHARYGQLPRTTVMEPAIQLAEQGFEVYEHLHKLIVYRESVLLQDAEASGLFFRADGSPLQPGDLLRQPDLAKTLRGISEHGADGFYQGRVAEAFVSQQERLGGIMTLDDLAGYRAVVREPVEGRFRGLTVRSMPPPSSGGVHVLQILQMLEGDDLRQRDPLDPKTIHLVASAMQRAFADRAAHLGDPDAHSIPVSGLIDRAYTDSLRAKIDGTHATSSDAIQAGTPQLPETGGTMHFGLIDSRGNAVVSTQSINGAFGAGIVVPGTGVVLNNHMDDFSAKPGEPNLWGVVGSEKNAIGAGRRPLSSMTPTLVLRGKRAVLGVGSPNGSRIISCVTLATLNMLEFNVPTFESIAAVRYHHQWKPDQIRVDDQGFPPALTAALEAMGHKVIHKPYHCRVQVVRASEHALEAASDPRGYGSALAQ